MTQQETIKLLAVIKLAYPSSYKDIDKETQIATVGMWHKIFSNVPYPVMEMALEHYVKTSKFPPTIAEMTDELRKLYNEALVNVLTLKDGKLKEFNKCLMQSTEAFEERNTQIINYGKIQTLLNGDTQPLLKG